VSCPGSYINIGSDRFITAKIASTIPSITKEKSVVVAEQAIGAPYNNHATRLEYVVLADQSAVLAHAIQVQNDEDSIFGEVFIDAHSGKLVSYTDFVFHATVSVFNVRYPALNSRRISIMSYQSRKRIPRQDSTYLMTPKIQSRLPGAGSRPLTRPQLEGFPNQTADPYIQLLPLTNDTARVHTEFANARKRSGAVDASTSMSMASVMVMVMAGFAVCGMLA
jgi:hypothetical protein